MGYSSPKPPSNLTAADVAARIERFLESRGSRDEWSDFCRVRIADPKLDAIRKHCARLPEEFPPGRSGRYCAPGGYAVLRGYLRALRGGETPSAASSPASGIQPAAGAVTAKIMQGTRDGAITVQGSVERETDARVANPADFSVEDSPAAGILRRIRPKNPPPKEAYVVTVFQAAGERPPVYPTDLPFIPNLEVSVTEHATGARVMQWPVEQPERVREGVLRAALEEGWERVARPAVPDLVQKDLNLVFLRRGDRWRFLTSAALAAGTFVKLSDVSAGTDWQAALKLH